MERVKSISICFNGNDIDNNGCIFSVSPDHSDCGESGAGWSGRSEDTASHLYAAFTFYPNLK